MEAKHRDRGRYRVAQLLVAGIFGLLPLSSHAVLLFDSGTFTTGVSYFADVDRGGIVYTRPADDFTLGTASKINGIG